MLTHNEISDKIHELTSHDIGSSNSEHTLKMIEIRKLIWTLYSERHPDAKKLEMIKHILNQ